MIIPAPMLPAERRTPPFGEPCWIYEIKYQGWRLIAGVDQGRVTLITAQGADATSRFPEICAGLAMLPGGPHVLDGQACLLERSAGGDSSRARQQGERRRWYERADPAVFYAFDLLTLNGAPLIGTPLEWRKAKLAQLLTPPPPSVHLVESFDDDHARQLLDDAGEPRPEGLVAKRLGSLYRPGARTPDWVKVPAPKPLPRPGPASSHRGDNVAP